MFVNYAHRGASEYAPDSTIAAFDMGIKMNANGIFCPGTFLRQGNTNKTLCKGVITY